MINCLFVLLFFITQNSSSEYSKVFLVDDNNKIIKGLYSINNYNKGLYSIIYTYVKLKDLCKHFPNFHESISNKILIHIFYF